MYESPSYLTHYYNVGSDILKNVCSQPDEVAEEFLSSLKQSGKRAWLHPGYLEERRTVEAWLYNEFVHKGKKPYLRNPLYIPWLKHRGFTALLINLRHNQLVKPPDESNRCAR